MLDPLPPLPSVPVFLPARWAASRFPGKLLRPFGDTTVLGHCIQTAEAAELGPVTVLAADARIEAEARRLGAQVVLVDGAFRNGSERIAAHVQTMKHRPDFVVNLQADAVGATPKLLRAALRALLRCASHDLGTVAVAARREEQRGRTTVSRSPDGRAASFSRHPLPSGLPGSDLLLHIGIYAYRIPALLEVSASPPSEGELRQSLEQLRWVAQGRAIGLAVVEGPADLAAAVDRTWDLP